MPLTPEEVEQQEFLVALRGYDKDEVHAFLRRLAADYRESLFRAQAADGDPFSALGDHVATMMRTAVEAASELRNRVEEETATLREDTDRDVANLRNEAEQDRQEAAAILEAARVEADQIRRAAEDEASNLRRRAEDEAAHVRRAADEEGTRRVDGVIDEATRRYGRLDEAERQVSEQFEAMEALLREMRVDLGEARLLTALEALRQDTVTADPPGLHSFGTPA